VLVICAQPFPFVLKSSVNSLPLVMLEKLAAFANRTDKTKSPPSVVVTAGPGVLFRVTLPLEIFAASGGEPAIPDTSQTAIST
jgi:hypothetical protein